MQINDKDYPVLLRSEIGSTLYGTNLDTSDSDQMGIVVEPKEFVVGFDNFEQFTWRDPPQGEKSQAGDSEGTLYSLRKYLKLALDGNPTVMLLLFVPQEQLLESKLHGLALQANAHRFISRNSAGRFLGYMGAQMQKFTGERSQKTNRPDLINEFGYDTKFAYHMLRLGIQGIELIQTGNIQLPMKSKHQAQLKAVRRGAYTFAEVLDSARYLEAELLTLRDSPDLPPKGDRAWVQNWMIETYETFWGYWDYDA